MNVKDTLLKVGLISKVDLEFPLNNISPFSNRALNPVMAILGFHPTPLLLMCLLHSSVLNIDAKEMY